MPEFLGFTLRITIHTWIRITQSFADDSDIQAKLQTTDLIVSVLTVIVFRLMNHSSGDHQADCDKLWGCMNGLGIIPGHNLQIFRYYLMAY